MQKRLLEEMLQKETEEKKEAIRKRVTDHQKETNNPNLSFRAVNISPVQAVAFGLISLTISLLLGQPLFDVTFVLALIGLIGSMIKDPVATFFHILLNTTLRELCSLTFAAIFKPTIKKQVFSNPFKSKTYRKRKETKFDLELATQDAYFREANGLLDLTTKSEGPTRHINFKVKVKVESNPAVLAELDSDSHISIISESYFLSIRSASQIKFLDEPNTVFEGLGSSLKSNYPPIVLNLQLGGVKLSGRFTVVREFTSSQILIGSDLMYKYGISLVAHPDGGWLVKVKDLASVPCVVEGKKVISNSKTTIKRISPPLRDVDLENILEPGLLYGGKTISKQAELDVIKQHKNIPDQLKDRLLSCLNEIPELFSGAEFSKDCFPEDVYVHDVELKDNAPTELTSRPFKLTGIRAQQLKENISEMVRDGILKPGDSEFTSPIFYVLKKPDAGKTASKGRLCFDYRRLNEMIKPLQHPITLQNDFFQNVAHYKVFSIIDIRNAFLSIKLTERAQKLCAITTPFGVFLPQRTPFGLKTSPSAFCRCMNIVLGKYDFCSYYLDDILVGGKDHEEMTENLIKIFKRLHKFNLKIQLSKVRFFEKEIKVLGTIFSHTGRKVDPEKVKAIQDFPKISSVKGAQAFLGMLAYICSFIPHFSTAMYPVFNLLKNQKTNKFEMTEEAERAVQGVKDFLSKQMQLYNIDLSKPLYLSTDASQVGYGSFLYQLETYPRTEEGLQACLKNLGFIPEEGNSKYLLPGVSPGRQTPIVLDFLKDENFMKHDPFNTLNKTKTMSEKLESLKDQVVHVKPIAFHSKLFTEGQILRYTSMEKEFLAFVLSILHFREYLEAAPITFVLSDSQPVLWALKHKTESVKLSRFLIKLWEFNFNLIAVHIDGKKNSVADFLSRIYGVFDDDKPKNKSELGPKSAQHIVPSFSPFSVLTKEDILNGFNDKTVTPCTDKNPDFCKLNVNAQLFRGLGPFKYEKTISINSDPPVSKRITETMMSFGLMPKTLQQHLTVKNIAQKQREDPFTSKIIEDIEDEKVSKMFFIEKGLLKIKTRCPKELDCIVLPTELVPYVLALLHFQSHTGIRKMQAIIRQFYWWPNLIKDTSKFVKGCVLCSTVKTDNSGKSIIGTPRMIPHPAHTWQIDVVSGLPPVKGCSSFLNCTDMFSGFIVAIPLKGERSEHIADALENHVFKIFGPPKEISSDNAANLSGPPVKKLLAFHGVLHRTTIPYSPKSHGLVEAQNKVLTQFLKIFSLQFHATWLDVMGLATYTANSLPKLSLEKYSPYFLMFGREPNNNFSKISEMFFDIKSYGIQLLNNQKFISLLYGLLLEKRQKTNAAVTQRVKSFPEGSLIYAKDFSKIQHKKVKPIFHRLPEKVLKEYRVVVYTRDLYGRIKRHSKDNIKMASERSKEMFSSLPEHIQMTLGSPMDAQIWDKIEKDSILPAYLRDIEIETEERELRNAIELPIESHLAPVNQDVDGQKTLEDEDDQDPFNDEQVAQLLLYLKERHNSSDLHEIRDLTQLKREYQEAKQFPPPIDTEEDEGGDDAKQIEQLPSLEPQVILPPLERQQRPPAGIDPANILPPNQKRERKVRFNL